MRAILIAVPAALIALGGMPDAVASTRGSCGSGVVAGMISADGVAVAAATCESAAAIQASIITRGSTTRTLEYRVVVACDPVRIPDMAGGVATNCSYAATACQFRVPPSSEPLYRVQYRARGSGGAWVTASEMCGLKGAPAGAQAPPAGPTPAMLLTAFRRLPFARATVAVDPPGGVTLVNLETYFRATWAGEHGLAPGQTSDPVVLLGQAVQFRIATVSYQFDFGDGTHSDSGSDPGATYPTGRVRHTYTHPQVALVRVEVVVTGQFRLGIGPWSDLPGTAALTTFPATRLVVREAHGRLVSR